ncbi:MAG: DUF4391 domain-containing protein [Halanaerobiales bacterium]
MFKDFIEKLNIPEACQINKKVHKKLFYEKGDIKYSDKKIFIDDIDQIQWLYTLNEDTIPIKGYQDGDLDYTEIALIKVDLKKNNRYERITDIMQRTIPYPLIIFFLFENRLLINTAYKRINQLDEDKATYDELVFSNWINLDNSNSIEDKFINSLSIKNLSYTNFYKFYTEFVDRIIAFNIACIKGEFQIENHQKLVKSKESLERIIKLQLETDKLRRLIKKEKQFNRRVELNMKIRKLESQIEEYKKAL